MGTTITGYSFAIIYYSFISSSLMSEFKFSFRISIHKLLSNSNSKAMQRLQMFFLGSKLSTLQWFPKEGRDFPAA